LVAPEVDDPVVPPVTAATVPGRDPALIVAAARLRQRHEKRLVRRPLVQGLVDAAYRETLAGGRGFELLQSPVVPSGAYSALMKSGSRPGARRRDAFSQADLRPLRMPKRFALPGTRVPGARSTFTSNSSSTARLTSAVV